MARLAVVFFLVALFVSNASARLKSVAEVKQSVTVVDASDTHLRAYQANWWPTVDPRIIQLLGVAVQLTDEDSAEVDAVEFVLSTYLQTALSFGYFHASGDIPQGNATEWENVDAAAFAGALRLFHVFEYSDVDGVPGFQNGTDLITGYYDLSHWTLTWKPMDIDQSTITVNGTDYNLFVITVETQDEVFLLRFICVGHPVEVEGVKITPDSIKVDLQIKWFNNPLFTGPTFYSSGPSDAATYPNARVGATAAMAAVAVSVDTSENTGTQSPSLTFETDSFTGFFEWADTVEIYAAGVQSTASVQAVIVPVEDPTIQQAFEAGWLLRVMYFTFDEVRAEEVVWDPTLGTRVDYDAIDGPSSAPLVQPLASLMFACLAAFYFF